MFTLNDDDYTVINGKKVLKDGRKITVPSFMMDSAQADDPQLRRPGPRFSMDAKAAERRETAFTAYVNDIGGAWRQPDTAPPATVDAKSPTTDTRPAALAARDADLANAWRGGSA